MVSTTSGSVRNPSTAPNRRLIICIPISHGSNRIGQDVDCGSAYIHIVSVRKRVYGPSEYISIQFNDLD